MAQAAPYRSVLYMPGSKLRALEKAQTLPADALILDLEDAVAPSEKTSARDLVCTPQRVQSYGLRKVLIRINGLDTEWGKDDLIAAGRAAPDGILVPKVNRALDVQAVASALAEVPERTRIWAMMETPLSMLNVQEIAQSHPRLEGFVLGTNDLIKELGAQFTPDRAPVLTSLSMCLLAARASGLICLVGVYNAFKDDVGLRAECVQGRALGFDGKTLIHPAQLDITNEVFAPSAEDVALARTQIEAFEAATAAGDGVAVVNGRIVENLHVETARNTLAKADAIAKLAAG